MVCPDYPAPGCFAGCPDDGAVVVSLGGRAVFGQENHRLARGCPDYSDIGQYDQIYFSSPRGPVHTIPFGSMGTVPNKSRDYIISKLDFRVRYDTDVDKVRKIIKMMQEAFQKNGIEFAHRNVTVYMPPGEDGDKADKKALEAGAAAAIAAEQAAAEKKKVK